MTNESPEERDRVCDAFEEELWEKIFSGEISLRKLAALRGKRLGCWCKPKRCHGDSIAVAAEWAYDLLERWEKIKKRLRKRKAR